MTSYTVICTPSATLLTSSNQISRHSLASDSNVNVLIEEIKNSRKRISICVACCKGIKFRLQSLQSRPFQRMNSPHLHPQTIRSKQRYRFSETCSGGVPMSIRSAGAAKAANPDTRPPAPMSGAQEFVASPKSSVPIAITETCYRSLARSSSITSAAKSRSVSTPCFQMIIVGFWPSLTPGTGTCQRPLDYPQSHCLILKLCTS